MSEKRYFWLKLYDDFFTSKRIKKLRSIAGGDTYTIIYLKMQLKPLKSEGYLFFDNVMSDFAEELALDIDENPDDVRVTVQYLLSVGLLECSENGEEYFLTYLSNLIGSETAHTQRQREYVKRKKERQKRLDASQNDAGVTELLRSDDADIEIEKDIEKRKTNTSSAEPNELASPQPPVITLILNDKSEYGVTQKDIDEYTELYPGVDVMQELRNMKGWCMSNPTRRKTKSGIKRFITNWLSKAQNHGGGNEKKGEWFK